MKLSDLQPDSLTWAIENNRAAFALAARGKGSSELLADSLHSTLMALPPLPTTRLEVVEDCTAGSRADQGFLRLRRQRLRACFEDGTWSPVFAYDQIERTALDAVVIAAHFRDAEGQLQVFLRSALRPPVALRSAALSPLPERERRGHLWEIPAGLLEPEERSERGLRVCAARELAEELGFSVSVDSILPLGPSSFPAPSVLAERHFYFHCQVDPALRSVPQGDGSPLEQHAAIVAVPVRFALQEVRTGEIEDAKTEIALRRLAEIEL